MTLADSAATARVTFRLELFVDDLAPALDFYCRVLGFRKLAQPPGGYE